METLQFAFTGGTPAPSTAAAIVVGVVASGNLEVMVEHAALNGGCRIELSTAARGFGPVWEAVLGDFFDRARPGDLRISINDMGATPAVVSLRLDQALEEFKAAPAPSLRSGDLPPQADR